MASSISESLVIFFRENGHSHDGVGSSPINTNIYSIFDFTTDLSSPFGNSAVQSRRALNQEKFDRYIESIISKKIIEDIDLAQRRIYEPYLYGGPQYGGSSFTNFIKFDFYGTWGGNGAAFDEPSTYIHSQMLLLKTDDMILESRLGGNTALYARLPTLNTAGTGISINTTSRQIGLTSSMRELKNNIAPVIDSISLLKKMNPVTFEWKAEANSISLDKFYPGYNKKYGFVVEDFEDVDRSLINYQYIGEDCDCKEDIFASKDNFKPIFYDIYGIVSILTASLKEAIKRIEYLESKLP